MTDIKDKQQVWFINFFVKKTGSRVSVNEELGEELKVAKIFKRRKVYSGFKDNIWAETSKQ